MKDVIVIAYSYASALCAIRSLGEAGRGTRLIALSPPAFQIAGASKYVTMKARAGQNYDEIFRAMEKLRAGEDRILVLSLHDLTTKLLDEHAVQLRERYCIPCVDGSPGKLTQLMNKMRQKNLAAGCGLHTPSGRNYTTDEIGIESALREAVFPVFQKPLASIDSKSVKALFAVCRDEEELRAAMRHAAENQCRNVLIEEYLEIDKELSTYGVAANGHVFMPALLEAVQGGFEKHRGVAREGIISSAKALGDTKTKLEEFVRKSGYTGLFCIDLIQSGGKLFFTEMNLRGGGSGYAVTMAGANLHESLAEMVYDFSDAGPEDIVREVHFLNEMIEADSFLDGYITFEELKRAMKSDLARFVFHKEDRNPWRAFCFRFSLRWLKRRFLTRGGRKTA